MTPAQVVEILFWSLDTAKHFAEGTEDEIGFPLSRTVGESLPIPNKFGVSGADTLTVTFGSESFEIKVTPTLKGT